MPDDIQDIIDQHDDDVDAAGDEFKTRVSKILHRVELALIAWLLASLSVRDGRIDTTSANVQVVEKIPDKVSELMRHYGWDKAISVFLSTFSDQFSVFQQLLKSQGVARPPIFSGADEAYFRQLTKSGARGLLGVESAVGEIARRHATDSIGGMLMDFQETVTNDLETIPAKARSLAITELSTFYRAVQSRGYEIMQAAQKEPLRFRYAGPSSNDPVIRPFCQRLMRLTEHGKTWTREQIDHMSNGQLPNVFVSCGGYNCRHQFAVVIGEKP